MSCRLCNRWDDCCGNQTLEGVCCGEGVQVWECTGACREPLSDENRRLVEYELPDLAPTLVGPLLPSYLNKLLNAAREDTTARAEAAEQQVQALEVIVGVAGDALDVADRIIERALGTDVPGEWNDSYRAVADARTALSSAGEKG